ncbi:MAG: asparagine synthase B [Myxococcota bacterium]
MCSIFAMAELRRPAAAFRTKALALSKRMRHRGPDWSGVWMTDRALLVHERLAIVDVDHGAQPLVDPTGERALCVNGEIYNHDVLRAELRSIYPFQTRSDCEVILALYNHHGTDFLNKLNGIFAFVLYDAEQERCLAARDPIGVMPLYWGRDAEGQLYFASEMKALVDDCTEINDFPPGHFYDSRIGSHTRYYDPAWRSFDRVASRSYDASLLASALDAAVRRQLMADVPWGVLLSGGLDSSLTSALAARHARRRIETEDRDEAWWPKMHSFAIGLEGSPDLEAAEVAARAVGTVHHGFHFTVQDGLDALRDVIHHLETFDVTTIRAATPMFLLARRIKAMGVKMVLSGEGSDEVFGGYLYFHKAPDAKALHDETVRKLDALHKFDCLRANKALAAWGVEGRVPFLDRDFLDVAMSFDPSYKLCRHPDGTPRIEKWALRNAFPELLPSDILWRQKEQFSDGVGYDWIDYLKAEADRMVSDADLLSAAARFPTNPPATKEAFWYRSIFSELFPHPDAPRCVPEGKSIACSSPIAVEWEASFKDLADPSGRAVRGVHRDAYRD